MKRTWRRRNYFIKREFQGRYMFNFFIFVIGGSFFFTIIFSLLSADSLTITYKDYNLQLGKTPFVLLKEILTAHWIFIVTGGLLVVLVSMFLTHRFAGPLFRLEKSLEEMNRGNFNFEITLRTKDEAKELAQMVNQFNNMISSNLKEIRDLSGKIDYHLTDVHRSMVNTEAGLQLDKAITLNRRLIEILHSFKLKNDK